MNEISRHFNKIAKDYDCWKKKNWYYYDNLKKIVNKHIPKNSCVLDIGCGTGDIMANLEPKIGIGFDISNEMIRIANNKYGDCSNLIFTDALTEEIRNKYSFDYIMLVDVVEHIDSLPSVIDQIRLFSCSTTKVFISMINPYWEPILCILELLKLKMPEGVHYRMKAGELVTNFMKNGFKLSIHSCEFLFPAYIPLISRILNQYICRMPILNRLGLIEYMLFEHN